MIELTYWQFAAAVAAAYLFALAHWGWGYFVGSQRRGRGTRTAIGPSIFSYQKVVEACDPPATASEVDVE